MTRILQVFMPKKTQKDAFGSFNLILLCCHLLNIHWSVHSFRLRYQLINCVYPSRRSNAIFFNFFLFFWVVNNAKLSSSARVQVKHQRYCVTLTMYFCSHLWTENSANSLLLCVVKIATNVKHENMNSSPCNEHFDK